MKKIFTLLFIGFSINVFGQNSQPVGIANATLDVSNINPTIQTGGDFFTKNPGSFPPQVPSLAAPGFEVPRGSGKHSIFAGGLWIGGRDVQNNLYVAAQTYRQGSPADVGFWPGPIGNVQGLAHNTVYDKIWKVSSTEIQAHIQNYANAGYSMPSDLATWPGNGNAANGEAAQLAPFIDMNNDGIYSPNLGDYPDIKGDQALYLILNDKGNVKEPVSASMNAEIHVMYYGFNNSANSVAFNTLFSEYRIFNRGQLNLLDFCAGIWLDFDLGNWSDDFVGCDTTANRFFVYNGDNYDNDSSTQIVQGQNTYFPVNGYGANPPVLSVTFLDQKMQYFMYYDNNGHQINGNPTTAADFYNYLRGIWRNNSQLTYGGNGTNQANAPVNYMFPGDPVTGIGWSERNTLTTPSSNPPFDRRGLGSIGPFNLNAGQELKFTVAYNNSRGTSNLNSVTQSHTDAIAVQNFFRNQIMGAPNPVSAKTALLLFPNPAQDQLQIQWPATFTNKQVSITITDHTGRKVLQKTLKAENYIQNLNIESLSKGIYQVSVTSENKTISSRLVKM